MASTSMCSRTAKSTIRSTRARMEFTFQVARRMASSLGRAGDVRDAGQASRCGCRRSPIASPRADDRSSEAGMLRRIADGVHVHESVFLKSNAVVIDGVDGV